MIPAPQDVARALCRMKRRRTGRTLLLAAILVALLAALLLATCFRPMIHTGRAMLPTLAEGDMYFVNRLDRTPEHGQLVLLNRTAPEGGAMLRRVIGLGGDEVSITPDGTLCLNGEALLTIPAGSRDMPETLLIPAGMLFVLGDNVAEALDSRLSSVGLIPTTDVLGTVW